jgi:DNA polymerase-3 subunit epsilon
MREIVLDTETTGLDPASGHRIVEIGCVEILNGIPTGANHHVYLDPQRDMPDEAFAVHGLSSAFLTGKPFFADVARAFLDFIGDAVLVAHNAEFDMRFLNAELERAGHQALAMSRVVDTLALARRRHPGSPASLDALCSRYGIDSSRRTKHGALLDAEILADVYIELNGGRQAALVFLNPAAAAASAAHHEVDGRRRARPQPLGPRLSVDEGTAHAAFVEKLGAKAIWLRYAAPAPV